MTGAEEIRLASSSTERGRQSLDLSRLKVIQEIVDIQVSRSLIQDFEESAGDLVMSSVPSRDVE